MLTCKICTELKDPNAFPINAIRYKNPTCKDCRNTRYRELRKLNPELAKVRDEARRAKPNYKEKHEKAHKNWLAKNDGYTAFNMRRYRAANPDYVQRELDKAKSNPDLKKYRLQKQLERQASNKALVNTYKQKPCMDCRQTFPPYVMDFDHVRGEKVGNISSMCANRPVATILTEIEKCDLVCSNCHRIRTNSRYPNKFNQ